LPAGCMAEKWEGVGHLRRTCAVTRTPVVASLLAGQIAEGPIVEIEWNPRSQRISIRRKRVQCEISRVFVVLTPNGKQRRSSQRLGNLLN
jgi:hypothetical protein